KSILEVARKIGVKSTKAITTRLKEFTGSTDHFNRNVAKYKKISIDELSSIIRESKTWVEIYQKMGYPNPSGATGREFKLYLQDNDIDISHLAQGHGWQNTEVG